MPEVKLSVKTPYNMESISYYRKWNSFDFYGKNHLRNFKDDPSIAIPGTQVKSELDHRVMTVNDRQKVEDSLEKNAVLMKHKLKIRDMGAKLNASVYMVILFILCICRIYD